MDRSRISETYWTSCDKINANNNYDSVYSDKHEHGHGVGILLNKKLSRLVILTKSERVILIKIETKPKIINVIFEYTHQQLRVATMKQRNSTQPFATNINKYKE